MGIADAGDVVGVCPGEQWASFRDAAVKLTGEEAGAPLPDLIRAVSLSPGTGEFSLDPQPSRTVFPAGGGTFAVFNDITSFSKFGCWGMFEHQEQAPEDSPEHLGIQDYLKAYGPK